MLQGQDADLARGSVRLDPPPVEGHRSAGPEPLSGRQRLALGLLAAVAVVVGFQAWPARLDDVPSDLGDPPLIAAILRWVSTALFTDPGSLFDFPFFHPEQDVLAYSEVMLPQALVFGAVHLVVDDWAAALTVTSLVLVWGNLAATFALARYLTRSTAAAVVAATAFGFSGYVYSHWSHTQLLSIGFVPWSFLLLLRLLESGRRSTAVALGVVQAGLVLASLYHGVIYALCAAVVVVAALIARRARVDRRLLGSLALAGGVTGVLLAPFVLVYFRVQRRYELVRPVVPEYGMDLGDLFRPPSSSVLRPVEVVQDHAEHALSPGLIAWTLAVVGAAVLLLGAVRSTRGSGSRSGLREGPLGLMALAGAVSLVVAASTNLRVAGVSPFEVLHATVPGFSGMRVSARLGILGVLAVCLLAAAGLAALLRGRSLRERSAVGAGLSVLVLLELLAVPPYAQAPPDAVGRYNEALADLPQAPVVELPIVSPTAPGPTWPLVEATRMVRAVGDGHPRVNGYSGFAPPDYDELVDTLAAFPARPALDRLEELEVRYAVVHVGCEAGIPSFSPEQVERLLREVGDDAVLARARTSLVLDLDAIDEPAEELGPPVGTCLAP